MVKTVIVKKPDIIMGNIQFFRISGKNCVYLTMTEGIVIAVTVISEPRLSYCDNLMTRAMTVGAPFRRYAPCAVTTESCSLAVEALQCSRISVNAGLCQTTLHRIKAEASVSSRQALADLRNRCSDNETQI